MKLVKGHLIAFNILNIGRYKLAAGVLGGSKSVIEQSAKYAVERQQFKVPIASFGAIQYKIAGNGNIYICVAKRLLSCLRYD